MFVARKIAEIAGTYGQFEYALRVINQLQDRTKKLDCILALAAGLLQGGQGNKGRDLIPTLQKALASEELLKWDRGRGFDLLIRLLHQAGRHQEAHSTFDEALHGEHYSHSLLESATLLGQEKELCESCLPRDKVAVLLGKEQYDEVALLFHSLTDENEKTWVVEKWITLVASTPWRKYVPSLIDSLSPEKQSTLYCQLAGTLLAAHIVIGVQQVINEALAKARHLPPFARAVAFARLVSILGRKERKEESESVAQEALNIANEQAKSSKEVLLEELGVHSARGGLLAFARLICAHLEDEERRGAVEAEIVLTLIKKGDRQGAREVVARINNPEARVRAGALFVESCLPVRGATWALRQVRLILELADMRQANKQSLLSLAPIIFQCAQDECQHKEAEEIFDELLEILLSEEQPSQRAA